MTPAFQNLLDTGLRHGWSLPERQLAEQFLAREATFAERSGFQKMSAFVKAEEVLSAENVRGLRDSLGKGLAGYVPHVETSASSPDANRSALGPGRQLRLAAKMKLRELREAGEPSATIDRFWEQFKGRSNEEIAAQFGIDDTQPARPASTADASLSHKNSKSHAQIIQTKF